MSPKKAPARPKRPRLGRPNPIYPPLAPKPFWKRRPKPVIFKLDPSWLKARAAIKSAGGLIVKEIIYEIELAVANAGKTLSNDAFQEFRPALLKGINTKLSNGGNWSADGANVRTAGGLMGTIAAGLAGSSTVVVKANVHSAFYAVKNGSTVCVNAGGGSWCDFFI